MPLILWAVTMVVTLTKPLARSALPRSPRRFARRRVRH
jgi:hypothetical protein